ncbi:MAG: DNA adenine methyltransferase YhdJ [Firmicutes bacterium ADurb.Bin419]|nr:MAG: DNA adenine methyltransferase YhdJ [Firmicutes bacterium ADurb.Bin419]
MKNINIVYKKIDELKPYKNNPRKNDKAVKAVADSIKEFGFKVPIIIDSNMEIIAGHTRLKAAKRLKYKEVPCIIADDLTPDQVRAFRLVDNKVGELAEWDIDLLNIELSEIELDLTPFDFKIEKTVNDIEEDDFEVVLPDEPKSKKGDIYILGNHRLMCGDSTNKDDVRKLMNGNQCDMIFTDPPYNVNYEGGTGMKIQNDNMLDANFYNFLISAFDNMYENTKMGGAIYVCHADMEGLNFRNAFKNAGYKLAACLIWVKSALVMGRQDYQWQHEPILYGWKEGAAHYFVNDRTQPTVIEDRININKLSKEKMKELLKEIYSDKIQTTIIHEDKPTKNDVHPTMKPLKLCGRLLTNSSRPGDLVVDFFGGSGSTMIACEQLDRICYMMELDEKYVDVIIDRWEKFTGRKAVKVE